MCLCMCMCSDRTVSCWKSNDSHIDVDSCDDWLWELVITVCRCFTLVLHDICDSVFHSLQTVLLVVLITPYYILCLFYFHTYQTVHYLSVIYCLFAERNWTYVLALIVCNFETVPTVCGLFDCTRMLWTCVYSAFRMKQCGLLLQNLMCFLLSVL